VRRVSDTEQPGPGPSLQATDLDGQELHVVPVPDLLDALPRHWQQAPQVGAERVEPAAPDLCGVAFRDHVAALPVLGMKAMNWQRVGRCPKSAMVSVMLFTRPVSSRTS